MELWCRLLINSQLSGKKSAIHLTGPFNSTITSEMRTWSKGHINQDAPILNEGIQYVIVDVSHPDYLESFVTLNQVIEVYDHHFGHEEFWQNRLGNHAKIEPVGACATLIWEAYKARGFYNVIDERSANLLYAAIVANTLNFRASVTTNRDRKAAMELLPFTTLPKNWVSDYYHEIEITILEHLSQSIQNDTKKVIHGGTTFFLSQLELWNAYVFLENYSPRSIHRIMNVLYPDRHWILSLISIEDGYNYLFSNTDIIEEILSRFMELLPKELGTYKYWITDRLWLRKEILRDLDGTSGKNT